MDGTIAVIGAGLAGLTAARALTGSGRRVVILDKGRGIGGRIAERRAAGAVFAHGAGRFDGGAPGFRDWMAAETAAGRVVADATGWRGVPGAKAPLRALALGLDIRQGVHVARVARDGGWWLTDTDGQVHGPFGSVISTMPAPQAARLFADRPALACPLATVSMDPQWAVLLAWATERPAPPDRAESLAGAALMPGPDGGAAMVLHAGPGWTRAHLDADRAEVPGLLLKAAAPDLPPADHADAHRWLYARTRTPLGRPVLTDETGTLFLGGDWTLGAAAGDAHESGLALARAARAALPPGGGAG